MIGSLLAVDIGIKTGLALFSTRGCLIWYRSHNFGTVSRLRRAVRSLLDSIPDLRWLVLEGGGALADIWENEAIRRKISVHRIDAEVWRYTFLYKREQKSGALAKRNAKELSRIVIDWSGASRPTSLRHDAAEAIMTGLWGTLHVGLLKELPKGLRRPHPAGKLPTVSRHVGISLNINQPLKRDE